MVKKLLIILLLFVIIGGAVWFFMFKGQSGQNTGEGGSFLSNLFPFGQGEGTIPPAPGSSDTVAPGQSTTTEETAIPRLRKVYGSPVAGATMFGDGNGIKIRFVERATGHIFETSADSSATVRLSNTTIPKVYEALWSRSGSEVLLRYVREEAPIIRTFYARIASSTPDQTIEGIFLDDGIEDIAIFGSKAFYFDESQSEHRGIVSNIDGTQKTAVFSSGFGSFISSWTSPNAILIYTAPQAEFDGIMYALSPSNGSYKKIASAAKGLTGLMNPQGTEAFVSSGGASISSSVVRISDLSSQPIPNATIAEKCVWGPTDSTTIYCAVPKAIPQGTYPDSWYQGAISFNDRIWKISAETGEAELVFDPAIDAGEEIDATNLAIDPSGKVLSFMNKKDLSLWAYLLEI